MGSIRPRILKDPSPGGGHAAREQVAVGSIRPRILKVQHPENSARIPFQLQWARSDRGY